MGWAFFQALRQRLAFEELHDQVLDAIMTANVEQGTDVWMLKLRDDARLALEALLAIGVVSLRKDL